MSHLIRSRKTVTTAPHSFPSPPTSATTAPAKMNQRLVNLVDSWRYLLPRGVVTAAPAMPDEVRMKVHNYLSTNYNFNDINYNVLAYVNRLFIEWYKQSKSDLHQYFQTFDMQVALEEGCQKEFEDREENWVWLCSHFQEPGYVKKAKANKISREKKTLLHHSSSRSFSYRMEARPQIDAFANVYVQPGGELAESLHVTIFPRCTLIENQVLLEVY
ncbi:hypothetical protein D8674_040589 [Pyrus ussuriensis x Pyrus communis]|uniref:Uncharacterized protein n=1 Tax=Pyrus ussuriensis x Pyrus communis TaxID=2448454 RepID=A0A5N5FBU3_9ROSA|nr:hypothetical protein D8674_040589 [Pyrus ussuriensis x Pyrus communis]